MLHDLWMVLIKLMLVIKLKQTRAMKLDAGSVKFFHRMSAK